MGEGDCEPVEVTKKGRHRKKQLYSTILQQMEFYFSDSNLSKDRFLSKLISDNPYVDIKVFLGFNKIRKLNCTSEDICKAIRKSELIEVSEDKEKIRRKTPLKVKEDIDQCTIYVENIKADTNHEWLKQVFSEFGNVVYVSIPKYKQNKENKGFAFIEFETETEAQNVLDFFETIGCKMPSSTSPDSLMSIKTFEEDGLNKHVDIKDTSSSSLGNSNSKSQTSKKRTLSNDDSKPNKKIRNESDVKCSNTENKEENSRENIEGIKTDADIDPQHKKDTKTETTELDDTENKKKKKHKRDKKKNHIKELGLQILSKRDWKKMRNRYLDLQKKKMKEFKQYLQKHGHKSSQKLDKSRTPKDDNNTAVEDQYIEESRPKVEYIPGVIVKLKLPEPCTDIKKLKSEIKNISLDVKYVDIPLTAGGEEVYIRFGNNETAKKFCHQEFNGERTIIEGEEEKLYWNKIQSDRTHKFTKSVKKQRGRDKLLKKAEKERAKHLRFDEGE